MNIQLTPTQLKILEEAMKKGFLTLGDMTMAYSTKYSRIEALERFKMAGLIEDDLFGTNRFKINKEKIAELLKPYSPEGMGKIALFDINKMVSPLLKSKRQVNNIVKETLITLSQNYNVKIMDLNAIVSFLKEKLTEEEINESLLYLEKDGFFFKPKKGEVQLLK